MASIRRGCVAGLALLAACSGQIADPSDLRVTAPRAAAASGTAAAASSAPGRTGPRRLTHVEYDNTVHDLLGTEQKLAARFAAEEADGFDDIASALDVTPSQFESYFNAADTLAAEFFADEKRRDAALGCTPSGDDGGGCLDRFLKGLGTRCYRRPLSTEETTGLKAAYGRARSLGESELGAAEHVLTAMLSSAAFLYRTEPPDLTAGAPLERALGGYELATRLSYLLWSSLPDDELFRLAADRSLVRTEVLTQQLSRMLADPRAQAFADNFAGQWLGMRSLAQHEVLSEVYPDFDPPLRAAMLAELRAYIAEFLFEDRPVDDFLRADLHFVDARLAAHYGVAAPSGKGGLTRTEQRIGERRGFLGLAAFLTLSSFAQRTSPTLRAKWILEQLLCSPVPPPPANVIPALEGDKPGQAAAVDDVRERLEQHRKNPACAGCHNLMDPLGLALESFDGIGKSRTHYDSGAAVDTRAVLPDGTQVDGPAALAEVLADDPRFARCVTQKLLTYTLGRTLDEEPALVDRTREAFRERGTLRALLEAVVTSSAFRAQPNSGGMP